MPQNNILVIKLGALGDFVQALGPMRAIRAHHPDAHITLLTTAPFVTLVEKSGYFDSIEIDTRPRWHNLRGWMDLRTRLNAGHYTRVYDLQNNDRTALYFKLFSPRPEWVGVAPGASHRNTSPARTAGLAFDGHVQTLALAGITGVTVDTLAWLDTDISHLSLLRPYMLIVPGCAPTRPEKRWPAESYGALCAMLHEHGLTPVIIGTADESPLAQTIKQSCPAAINLTGQTSLLDIVPLARGAAAAIGNDTGPMHLIAPTGCPSLVLFSSASNPARHAPQGEHLATLQADDLANLSPATVMEKFEKIIQAWA
jgi:ADP-heptose:LPS heptosyltransferase